MKPLAKILLCISVTLLFTHQLIPHDHDEHTDHMVNCADHHLAGHNIDHLFSNNNVEPVIIKAFVGDIGNIQPFLNDDILISKYITQKRDYEKLRPPLIKYCNIFPLRAPPSL